MNGTPEELPKHNSAKRVSEKVLMLSSRAKRGICFFAEISKKQIPRANPALRNDMSPLFRSL